MTKDGGVLRFLSPRSCLAEILQNSTMLQIALIHRVCARSHAFCAQVKAPPSFYCGFGAARSHADWSRAAAHQPPPTPTCSTDHTGAPINASLCVLMSRFSLGEPIRRWGCSSKIQDSSEVTELSQLPSRVVLEARGFMGNARCFCVVLQVFFKKIPLDGFSQLIISDHFLRNDEAPSPKKQHHSCLHALV